MICYWWLNKIQAVNHVSLKMNKQLILSQGSSALRPDHHFYSIKTAISKNNMYNFIKIQKLFAKHRVLGLVQKGTFSLFAKFMRFCTFFPLVPFNHFHFFTLIITGPPSLPQRGVPGSFQCQSVSVSIHLFKVGQKNHFRLVFLCWIEAAPSRRSLPATIGSGSGLPPPGSTGAWRGPSYSPLWSRGPACTAAQTEKTHNEKTGVRGGNP